MSDNPSERRVHDLGGLPGDPIDRAEKPKSLFDRRVDAMLVLLTHPDRAAFTVDAMRRAIEGLSAEDYERLTYYQKWCHAIRLLVVEQGLLSDAELAARIRSLRETETPAEETGA